MKTEISTNDFKYMQRALELAREAGSVGEVPVGCVIVRDGIILAEACNRRERDKNAIMHAEIEAIGIACSKLGDWRLDSCTLFVTLEPCPMCAGAIVNARVPRVVFGTGDPKAGAFGSLIDLRSYPLNHKPEIVRGVCGDECAKLLREFFLNKRSKK